MPRSRGALILSALAMGSAAAVIARRRSRLRAGQPGEPKGALRNLWTRVDGSMIYARASRDPAPDRLPVVLVHGYGMSSSYMVPIAERLAAELPVYAPDLPGHGRSGDPGRTLTVPELAEVLRAWMDEVGIERAALLGNSMGCQIVAAFAARWPERVDRLILVGPTADAEARTLRQHLPRLLRAGAAERISLPFLVLRDYGRAGLRRIARELQVMFEDRIEDNLPRITAPALVLRGERDAIVPQRWAEEVARGLGAEVRVIPGAGHALNYSAADELMRMIRPFLRETTVSGEERARAGRP
ncbi:MAG TPA: alpha/beta fold hydrolase [Thermoanaerobaculia bacterium]